MHDMGPLIQSKWGLERGMRAPGGSPIVDQWDAFAVSCLVCTLHSCGADQASGRPLGRQVVLPRTDGGGFSEPHDATYSHPFPVRSGEDLEGGLTEEDLAAWLHELSLASSSPVR
jgi:hypothetical protein